MFSEIKERKKYKFFINGEWRYATNNKFIEIRNPFNNELVSMVPSGTKEDAEECIKSAFKAKEIMRNTSAEQRHKILIRTAELLKEYENDFERIIINESGKPIHWVKGELHASIERIKYAASEARDLEGKVIFDDSFKEYKGKMALVVKEPVGVVLAIGPFNYPLFTGASKIVEAIASGNSIIVKPASDDPTCLLMFIKLLEKAGIPKQGINVITGSAGEIGDYLVKDERIDMISFTGSSRVGKRIAEISGMKKKILELGGKCPALVLNDAELKITAKECVKGCFKMSGQRCDAISRVIIIDQLTPHFLKEVKKEIKNWKTGDPKNPDVKIGPLINQKAVDKVKELVDDALSKGAEKVVGGKINGLFYPMTILDKVTEKMRIAWEETFGPVMTILRVKNEKEAIETANKSGYGLDASVFTVDLDKAVKTSLKLKDGSVHINRAPSHGVGKFPFGGDKDSGLYREGIKTSINEMLREHTIVLNID